MDPGVHRLIPKLYDRRATRDAEIPILPLHSKLFFLVLIRFAASWTCEWNPRRSVIKRFCEVESTLLPLASASVACVLLPDDG